MSNRARSDNSAGFRRSEAHLERALDLARQFRPHPNPRVGAVVVSEAGDVVGEGAHRRAGDAHAEVVALTQAGDRAAGSTVYVTLEPCSHHGRTPPCAEALIGAGVARVVAAADDPDPRVAGAGMAALRAAGIDVVTNANVAAGEQLDPGYFHHKRTGRPLVTLKLATTLDGQVAALDGSSQWITGEAARRSAHELRSDSDAVVVGAGTLRADDPRLDVRLDDVHDRQPRPVIIGGAAPLPSQAAVYARNPLIYRHEVVGDEPPGIELVTLGENGRVDLDAAVKDLGSRGFLDLMVEGGPAVAAAFLAAGLVDRVVIYLGPKLAGGTGFPALAGVWATLEDAVAVDVLDVELLGGDVKITARVVG